MPLCPRRPCCSACAWIPRRPWQDIRSIGTSADSAGWHCLYVADHFMPHDVLGRPRPGPVLEAWSCLTALAMLTRQVRVGTLVLGSTYRHPAVVANMAATVDQLSAGRLTLGVGAGWQTNEHRAYGISLPERAREAGPFRGGVRGHPSVDSGRADYLPRRLLRGAGCLLRAAAGAAGVADSHRWWGRASHVGDRGSLRRCLAYLGEQLGVSPQVARP